MMRRIARAAGLTLRTLGDGVWLVQLRRAGPPAHLQQVGESAWLVQRGRRPRLRRVGKPGSGVYVLFDRKAARARMHQVQNQLARFLAEEQVAWVLRELDVNCVLDVGANRGQYASRLRRSGYRGRIVSFEPVSALADQLSVAAADDPDWHVVQCALGDEEGSTEIHAFPGTLASLRPSSEFGRSWSDKLQNTSVETVAVRRLDSVVDEVTEGVADPRLYLKLDTQGYDLQAFRGAGDRLAEVVGMQSEVACVPIYEGMPRLQEQLDEYEAAGVEVAGMFPVSRHRPTLRIIEFDLVMVRADPVSHAS